MPTPFIDSVSGLVAAQWVGLTFAFASAGKLLDRTAAVTAVERFQLLPASVSRIVGTLLPWIELLLALSLIVGVAARAGASVAITLLVVFSIAQATVLVQGRRVECGCFGSLSSEPVRLRDIARNALLILGCLWSTRATMDLFELFRHTPNFSAPELVAVQLMGTGIFLQFALIRSVLSVRRHEGAYQQHRQMRMKALAVQTIPGGSI